MSKGASELIVCPHCDVLHRDVTLGRHEVAACVACGRVLGRHRSLSVDQLLALTLAAALLIVIASAYPLMSVEIGGMHTEATIWGAAWLMLSGWAAWPGVVIAITMLLVPLLQIALLIWILMFVRLGHRAPGSRALLVALHWSRPWSMTEVFLLGAVVAIVKLSGWVHIVPGMGIWALASLTVLLTIFSLVDVRSWWALSQIEA